jgi:hypothetical protein
MRLLAPAPAPATLQRRTTPMAAVGPMDAALLRSPALADAALGVVVAAMRANTHAALTEALLGVWRGLMQSEAITVALFQVKCVCGVIV